MSILVRGMGMPRDCSECFIQKRGACPILKVYVQGWGRPLNCPLIEAEEFEVWPNRDPSRKFNILKTKGGMHFMGPNGPVDPPKGAE